MSRFNVIAPDQGKKYFLVGDHVTLKIATEETSGVYAAAVTWVAPGGGPPPHLHRREDELFYVLEGTMLFVCDRSAFIAGPGDAVYLPRNLPHLFKNIGDTPIRFIITAIPGGFDAFVAECGEAIDTIPCSLSVDQQAIGKLLAVAPKYGIEMRFDHPAVEPAARVKKDKQFRVLENQVTLKLSGADTSGNFSVAEITSQPSKGIPAHRHADFEEFFYILEGEFEFVIDGQTVRPKPGALIRVPRGVEHAFRNVGTTPARLVDFVTPGEFEKVYKDAGIPCVAL